MLSTEDHRGGRSPARPPPGRPDGALLAALARAAAAMARLDQATAGPHPLLPALLHRARLEAVRQQAAVDGQLIDPWHLAALIEGLRPRRLDGARSIAEAGSVFEAGRTALAHHAWLTAPDGDAEGAIRAALAVLRDQASTGVPLLDAAHAAWRWLDGGGPRPPLRAALVRHWTAARVLTAPLPLTGAAALRAEVAWAPTSWVPAFLDALATEADATLDLLVDLERGWIAARGALGTRRRHSRAPAAVDLLAAAPLLSATTLAGALGLSVKSALALLEDLRRRDIAVEVSGRSARRLFALRRLAPLAAAVAPPRRPVPGRGRGRPRATGPVAPATDLPPPPAAPLGPLERRAFDYGDLTAAMAAVDAAIRRTRRTLDGLANGGAAAAETDGPEHAPDEADGFEGGDSREAEGPEDGADG